MARSFAETARHRAEVLARAQAAAADKAARREVAVAAKAARSDAFAASKLRSRTSAAATAAAPAEARRSAVVRQSATLPTPPTACPPTPVLDEASGGGSGASCASGDAEAAAAAVEGPWWSLPEDEVMQLRDFVWPQGRGAPSLASVGLVLAPLAEQAAKQPAPGLQSALGTAFGGEREDIPRGASAMTGLRTLRRRLECPLFRQPRAELLRTAGALLRLAVLKGSAAGRSHELLREGLYFVGINLRAGADFSARLGFFGAEAVWRALRSLAAESATDSPSPASAVAPRAFGDDKEGLEAVVAQLSEALQLAAQGSPGRPFLVAALAEAAGFIARAAGATGAAAAYLPVAEQAGRALCDALGLVAGPPRTPDGHAIEDAAALREFRNGASETASSAELEAALRGIAQLARPALCPAPAHSCLAAAVPLAFELGRSAADPSCAILAMRVWALLATCGVAGRDLWAARLLMRRAQAELSSAPLGQLKAPAVRLRWCHVAVDLAVAFCVFPQQQRADGFGRAARLAVGLAEREAEAAAKGSSSSSRRAFAQPVLRAVGLLALTAAIFGPSVLPAALGPDEAGQSEVVARRLVAGGLGSAWVAGEASEAGRRVKAAVGGMLADALRRPSVRCDVRRALMEVRGPGAAALRGLLGRAAGC